MRILVLSFMIVFLASMSLGQTAGAHACLDSEKSQTVLLETGIDSNCEHENSDHKSCCTDLAMRHCSSGSVLFVGQPSTMAAAPLTSPFKVEAPIDTAIRAKHSSTLFRPPITTA